MTTFYLIRHGERSVPENVLVGRAAGVSLTERGRDQAKSIARHLATIRLDRVISSPLERARETAVPLARVKNVSVEISPAFDEVDFGEWTGRACEELENVPAWKEFNHQRSLARAPQGEAPRDVQVRFVSAMLEWQRKLPDGNLAVVSHGDPIKMAISYFAGMPLDLFDRLLISYGSISEIAIGRDHVKVVRINEVPRELDR